MALVQSTSYSIYIDESYDHLYQRINELAPTKIFVITDNNTELHCLPYLKKKLHLDFLSLCIPTGESYKNIDTCKTLWETIAKHGGDRKSLVINLGGGVIGDMGGFVAATYMRGIPFIQIPTSLLSQVDASVGSKLGIDLNHNKNMVGLFTDPDLVWIDTTFLSTLPDNQLKSGFAEIIKHALVRSQALWNQITHPDFSLNKANWKKLVLDNVEIKNYVVKQDPKEGSLRKVLNFGHTVGHAIESFYLNSAKPLLHGEAIAIGMICESYISHKISGLSENELDSIQNFISQYFGKKEILEEDLSGIIDLIKYDKKNHDGETRFSLITNVGKSITDQAVEKDLIKAALKYYLK